MKRPPPRSTLTYTLFPSTTLFRSEIYSALDTPPAVVLIRHPVERLVLNEPTHPLRFADRIDPAGEPETVVQLDAELELAASTARRSEEHTSELQSLMRISYAVFCLKKKK